MVLPENVKGVARRLTEGALFPRRRVPVCRHTLTGAPDARLSACEHGHRSIAGIPASESDTDDQLVVTLRFAVASAMYCVTAGQNSVTLDVTTVVTFQRDNSWLESGGPQTRIA